MVLLLFARGRSNKFLNVFFCGAAVVVVRPPITQPTRVLTQKKNRGMFLVVDDVRFNKSENVRGRTLTIRRMLCRGRVLYRIRFVSFGLALMPQKGAEGGDAQGWGGAVEDNVAFQFSLGPAKTAVVLTITEEVCMHIDTYRSSYDLYVHVMYACITHPELWR